MSGDPHLGCPEIKVEGWNGRLGILPVDEAFGFSIANTLNSNSRIAALAHGLRPSAPICGVTVSLTGEMRFVNPFWCSVGLVLV